MEIKERKIEGVKEPAGEKREPTRRESLGLTPRTPEEEILEMREKVSSKPIRGWSNRAHFISFKDDGDGVFKPLLEEYKQERAAYLVDRFLGFDFVPPTIVRAIDGKLGSIQQFIHDASLIYDTPERKRDIYKADLIKLWIFDYIIWNMDRHGGNFLLKDGKILAIDHGSAFSDRNLFFPYKSYPNELIPQEIIEKINKFLSWPEGIKILSDLLGELLSEEEVKACVARIKKLGKLLEKGRIDSSDKLNFDPKLN